MKNSYLGHFSCLLVATMALTATGAISPAAAACEPMELVTVPGTRVAELIDYEGDGRDAGDHHIGSWRLADASGNEVAKVNWVATTVNENISVADTVLTLADGSIHTQLFYDYGGTPNVTASGFINTILGPVVGGTGSYKHASGTMEILHGDGSLRYVLDIKCQ